MVIITSYEKDYRVVLLCVLYGSYCCSLLNLVANSDILRAFNSVTQNVWLPSGLGRIIVGVAS